MSNIFTNCSCIGDTHAANCHIGLHQKVKKLTAEIARLKEARKGTFRIKPLVFERESSNHYHADSFGSIGYLVSNFADNWWVSAGAAWIQCDSLEDGIAKCNEHYRAFISQALEPVSL